MEIRCYAYVVTRFVIVSDLEFEDICASSSTEVVVSVLTV